MIPQQWILVLQIAMGVYVGLVVRDITKALGEELYKLMVKWFPNKK